MSTPPKYTLVSHTLCPYVQRAVITLKEKGISYERIDVDLANKPEWFNQRSPLGKVPLLIVDDEHVLFESNVITEYLNEITPGNLHDPSPLIKAKHRAWIEYGSGILNNIGGLYSAKDQQTFEEQKDTLLIKLQNIEAHLQTSHATENTTDSYFSGPDFHLIDAAYGPIFRYFNVFKQCMYLDLLSHFPRLKAWNNALQQRLSIINAVNKEYPLQLKTFIQNKRSYLGNLK